MCGCRITHGMGTNCNLQSDQSFRQSDKRSVDRSGGENAAHGLAELVLERDALLLTGVGCDTASIPTCARFDAERDLRPLVDIASGSAWAGIDAVGGIAV